MNTPENEPGLDYLAILRRRRWSLLIPILLGIVVGGALAVLLPREYTATTTIAVTAPSVSGGLASTTQADQVERVRAVSHELLSSPVVEQVAHDERLLDGRSMDAVVTDIRQRTTVALPPRTLSAPGRYEPDTFVVSYTGRTPELAQRVASQLAQVFIDSHSRKRETRAEQTSAFLERQLTQARERMDAAEARLRETKSAYQGRLPEQTLTNLQAMNELRRQADSDRAALQAERERLSVVEQQIEAMRQDAQTAAAEALDRQSRERLSGLENTLAEARQKYTDRHPEVQRLEEELARAKAEDAEARRLAGSGAGLTDPALRELVAEREQARLRIREFETKAARAPAELARYQELVNGAPIVEQRLMSLTQAYEFEKQQYQKLAEQYQTAMVSEELEHRQAGERFFVLYAAERPRRPSSPNVLLVLGAALVGGLVLGVGLAALRELMDRSVHDRRTLEATFGRPVLAEIPRF
ncbi:MAG: Wzz/FepE/Etk N-terminal domain-containing protein [Vicinamibacterales bacterium]